jgi:hypothetical protein
MQPALFRGLIMSTPLVLALLAFWIFLAFRALQRGDTTMAVVLVVLGIVLTVYRLQRRKG